MRLTPLRLGLALAFIAATAIYVVATMMQDLPGVIEHSMTNQPGFPQADDKTGAP